MAGINPRGVRVWCLRHAQSHDNASRVLSNRPPGAGLSELGRSQANAAARRLAAEPVSAVYGSPALRARETAATVATACRAPAYTLPGLLECDIGICEGRADDQAHDLCLDVVRRWVVGGDLDARVQGGESGRETAARFRDAMTRIAADHVGQTVVAVSHVATLTVGLMALCEGLTPEIVWGRPPANAVPFLVEFDEFDEFDDGVWRCAAWPGSETGRS